ncbi:hypothetical protein Sulfitobl28_30110 [Sulfitobacter pontiacus]|nr:hypothetical protein Sulfitobl28_30110 [Sulfitobacter pontiacus]
MFTLSLIGIGSGNPKHLTLQAIDALNACDVILIPSKGAGKDDLAGLRHEICAQVLRSDGPEIHEFTLPKRDAANPDYHAGVHDWHDAIAQVWLAEMQRTLPQGGRVGFLVWGIHRCMTAPCALRSGCKRPSHSPSMSCRGSPRFRY